MTTIQRNAYFAKQETPTGIIVPEVPVLLQANCAQKGQWIMGEKAMGNESIDAFILSFHLGIEHDPYKRIDFHVGTILFVAIDCDFLKPNLVYSTKIKNQQSGRRGSLSNFGAKSAEAVASGLDPREVLWTFRFVNKSGNLPDGSPYNCAVLDFSWRQVKTTEEAKLLDNCVFVLEEERQLLNLQAQSVNLLPAENNDED